MVKMLHELSKLIHAQYLHDYVIASTSVVTSSSAGSLYVIATNPTIRGFSHALTSNCVRHKKGFAKLPCTSPLRRGLNVRYRNPLGDVSAGVK